MSGLDYLLDGGAGPGVFTGERIAFEVYGRAAPAGSKRHVGGGRIVDASKKAKPWQALVRAAALEAYDGPLLAGALTVLIHEERVRPRSHYGKHELNARGRETPFPSSRPDLLKVGRGIEDALSGVLYGDDAQIVLEVLIKTWGPRDVTSVSVVGMA